MRNFLTRYGVSLLVMLIVLLWFNKDRVSRLFYPAPKPESLEFNQPKPARELRPIVVSSDEKNNIDIFEKVHPAVVNIAATALSMNFWMEIIPREGQGSGFIIDGEGYILTNHHVVAKAQKITVTLAKGTSLPATLIGRDPASDLAVIKIPSESVGTVATLGDSDEVRVGQKAIAIGNPFGLSHTLTTGIVSALRREIRTEEGSQITDLIQTDAAINPGNSGGPLLNSNGEVIGINTAIFSVSGGYQGIGFAIPINRAKEVATQLITSGRVRRPWLGITGIHVTPDLAAALRLGADQGILVVEVLPGSPAHQAGLRGGSIEVIVGSLRLLAGGDIITAVDGRDVAEMKALHMHLDRMKVGQEVSLRIVRDRAFMDLKVLLGERP